MRIEAEEVRWLAMTVRRYSSRDMMLAMSLVVYTASWCRDCRTAKKFLQEHDVAFTEVDIEETPGAAEEVIENVGKRAIPQFVIDGKWVQPYKPGRGFLFEEMSALLQVGAHKKVG